MTYPRQTEIFIVMTMYNEDDSLFTWTIQGVVKNTAYLCDHDRSKTWGKDSGWLEESGRPHQENPPTIIWII